MSTKKIWLFAMVFGLIAAGMMFAMVTKGSSQSVQPVSAGVVEEEEIDNSEIEVTVFETEEESKGNVKIPVSEGNRALTIAVTSVEGVAGFINPGSFVDVVAILIVPEEQKDNQHDAATLLLQNVKVLAVGHAADDEDTRKNYEMVTVEVTPTEGLTLGFATKYDLHLMLRHEGDGGIEPGKTHVHEDELHKGVFK